MIIILKMNISYEIKMDNKKERINPMVWIYPLLYINQPLPILLMWLLSEQALFVSVLAF